MFDCLLKRYEAEVFNTEAEFNIWKVLKSHKRVRIMVLVCMIVVGMILSVVRQKNGCGCLSLCAFLVTLFCIFLLFNQMKSEEPIILEAIKESATETQMEKMIKLLKKFNIYFRDERKLNQLIERAERAEKEQDQKKLWSLLKNVIFMVLSAFLTKIFKEADWQTSIDIAIKPILISAMALFFGGFLRDFFFISKKQILDSFISDVEDIKLFPKIVRSMNRE
jgi:Ca2+/H+ antiporter